MCCFSNLSIFHCRKAGSNLIEALDFYYNFFEDDESVNYVSDCIHENIVFLMQGANETLINKIGDIVTDIRNNSHFILSFQPQVI